MKTLTLTGNIGCDLILRTNSSTGKQFYTFTVAHYEGKNADGTPKPSTWVDVILPADHYLVKYVESRVKKGLKVIVTGSNKVQAYINRQGQASASESLYLKAIEVLSIDKNDDPVVEHTEIEEEVDFIPS